MEMVEEICKHCKHCLLCMCGDEFNDCKLKKSPTERALDFGKMLKNHGESEDSYTSAAAGYEKGATEQKAIDDTELHQRFEKVLNGQKWDLIDKACEWLLNNLPTPDWWGSTEDFVVDFRKAMEE